MSHSQYRNQLDEDLRRLRRLLDRAIPQSPPAVGAPVIPVRDVSILDVACGACDEARMLSDFLGERHAGPDSRPARTRLLGIDIRERELDEARARFRSSPAAGFEFIRADASKPGAVRELDRSVDAVFLRHQNLYNGGTLWRRIFENALERLDDQGLLIMTSYFDREHGLAVSAFQNLGAELIANHRNPASRPLPYPGKSVDRHIAVFRRPESFVARDRHLRAG
jgi:hypothetical protein